jgi:hypothetical protein
VAEKAGMRLWKTVVWRDLEHWVMAIQKEAGERLAADRTD